MNIYINGMGNISPQQTWGAESLLPKPLVYKNSKLTAVEPDYTSFVDAKQLRRMSRIIRMGVASAAMALRESGITTPDGIITATGYGCLEDTGIFLTKLVDNKEQALNPTPFIQSTHNTIGSQIALLLQCLGYNQTYTQGAFSFESGLLDAMLQLLESPEQSMLVGGIDEVTPVSHQIQNRFGIFRSGKRESLELFKSGQKGTLNGEGSSFFVLSGIRKSPAACIKGVTTFYRPEQKLMRAKVEQFLSASQLNLADIDLILLGKCGDARFDKPMDTFVNDLFPGSSRGLFKHLCGEFPTASSFALWLAASIIKQKQIPGSVIENDRGRGLKSILIYNQYFATHHSFIVLQAC